MKERHISLVVEDDHETAQDLVEILRSVDCDSVVVDNREDALAQLRNNSFCLILLDLEIRGDADSIKGHVEYGRALLRDIREKHHDHNGTAFWLPVLVVSGFARERDEALGLMKDGANDVIQKPLKPAQVSEGIRQALQASGRKTHSHCGEMPKQLLNVKDGVVIAIPGNRIGRRTRVTVASKSVEITDKSLKVLLHLMIAQQKGRHVHKIDLGATSDQGFKGVSILRHELKPVVGDVDIIKNHYHGLYSFEPNVIIGECAITKLLEIGDTTITDLAKLLQSQVPNQVKKSEGNSGKFPPQRRRPRK